MVNRQMRLEDATTCCMLCEYHVVPFRHMASTLSASRVAICLLHVHTWESRNILALSVADIVDCVVEIVRFYPHTVI